MDFRQVVLTVWIIWTTHSSVHCIETRNIVCKFQGDWCGYTQDTTDDFDWSMAREETSKNRELEQNAYICACRNTTSLRPGSLTRLVSPIYEVMTPSLLSLQFKHFKTEGDGSRLRISTESTTRSMGSHDEQPFFRPLDEMKTTLPWTVLEGKTDVFGSFQLVIEAEVGYFTQSRVAVDNIILTLYSYPVLPQANTNGTSSINSSGGQQLQDSGSDALTSWSNVTSDNAAGRLPHSNNVHQERMPDSGDEGVSLCFILAVTSSSLLFIVLVIFLFVVLSLSKRKRRYQRFNFGHDYEEITGKEPCNKTTSVSAMAIMKERPQPPLAYHNRHTSFSRIQSLSNCLSTLHTRDSLRSSIYAEITEADLDLDAELSDPWIGNTTTMTTTCTATWDISSSTDGSVSDVMLAGGSDVTASSIHKVYPSVSYDGSHNDSGWVENIIYERTSDVGSFNSTGGPFSTDKTLKGFGYNKMPAGFKTRQRVHTV